MNFEPQFTQALCGCRDPSLAGGKAVNLGCLLRAGFPVPDGFVVTTRAYRLAQSHSRSLATNGQGVPLPAEVAEEVRVAYREMGGGAVAVRSSATAEDAAAASMAGQYETLLDVDDEAALLSAVLRCWAGLDAPRACAYLQQRGIDPSGVAMAVVVQRLVPADVAGVLFTTNPHNGRHREMLVEASWGLGESVVSGQVQPDALRLDQETGRVLAADIADKHVELTAGAREPQPVEHSRRRRPCLRSRDVCRLWELGRQAAAHFGSPQDIEWAIHAGEIYILQSRPITTLPDAGACDEVLRTAREHLRQESAAGRGPWVLHNLAETLPHPTPLTWSVIARFMSGSGGFGTMYRQAGFEPSPTVDREGFLELIAGRVYMDASRASEMLFQDFPFAYDPEELKRSPDASQKPPTLPRGSLIARFKAGRRLAAVRQKLLALSADFDRRLRDTLLPGMAGYVFEARQADLRSLGPEQLIDRWQEIEGHVLDTFGPQSLMPSLIAEMAMEELRTLLTEHFWDEDPDALASLLSSGGPPDRTVTSDAELYEVGKGSRPLDGWLAEHGHRGPGEFDLAAPRWREQPAAVGKVAARLAAGEGPLERHRRNAEAVQRRVDSLQSRLCRRDRRELDRRIELVRRYIAFREDGKDYLMLGYDLLRDLAIEASRRLEVGEDVFYLTRDELFDALRVGFAPCHLIDERRSAYQAEAILTLPRMIDQQAIDTLGDAPATSPTADGQRAMSVSSGRACGPARILTSPTAAGDLGHGYILVCPSTDPAWTPLLANAAGLVLERGGALSHGAVVAREMGVPAVVLPDATQLFRDGEQLCVDGDRGWVGIRHAPRDDSPLADREEHDSPLAEREEYDDVRVAHELVPPPPGRRERRAAKLRNVLAIIWTAFLLAVFLLPEHWLYQPTLSVLDSMLWPIVRWTGRPATVAMIAAGVAVLTLVAQKLIADNRRVREAKRRAAALNKLARALPKEAPRRAVLLRLARPVPLRTLGAAMVPVGILLGPMVLSFVWLQNRVDPAAWNAPAGSTVQVVATVDGDWGEPVQIEVPAAVVVDEATPASRTLPPLRKTLERLLAMYRQPRTDPGQPWEFQAVPDLAREQTADDLQAYLAAGIPPQGITWLVRPPEDLSGRFPLRVTTPGHPPVPLSVVLGDEDPPAPRITKGVGDSPVKDVRLVYPKPKVAPIFWRPLSCLEGAETLPLCGRLSCVDVGWLGLYIIAYLPILLVVRPILRLA